MTDPRVSDWRDYSTSIEVLKGAIQQMGLIPLKEMQSFLEKAIQATEASSELSRRKIRAAKRQLSLISISRRYFSEVTALLEEEAGEAPA